MNKHTPGPWEAYNENEGMDMAYGPLWCVSDERYHNPPGDDSGYCFQAQINCGCEGDARLIAAAPDLLNALTVLEKFVSSMGIPTDAARAAIAKATREDGDE